MLVIDGSIGEGGGQVLRSALALSLYLITPFKIINIRLHRSKPGLQPQHLAAVKAAAEVSDARMLGDTLHSTELEFIPRQVEAGNYVFEIGTAGSTSLVLQTLLPALMLGARPSRLQIMGGTHNPMAPTYEFLHYAFLPLLSRMGPGIRDRLVRPGFYPRGGGCIETEIQPVVRLQPLELLQRGPPVRQYARILSSRLPRHIAEREWQVIRRKLHYKQQQQELVFTEDALSPGNAISLIVKSRYLTTVFTALGKPGLPAEKVAQSAIDKLLAYLASTVPVDPYLADQLLLPIALAGQGVFRTSELSSHTRTNMAIIPLFTDNQFMVKELAPNDWEIRLTP